MDPYCDAFFTVNIKKYYRRRRLFRHTIIAISILLLFYCEFGGGKRGDAMLLLALLP